MFINKYNASGNDFVITHGFISQDRSVLAKRLCHRQEGIGADGFVYLLPHNDYDFVWEFYNADGSTASMCGNASRAVAHYAYMQKLAPSCMTFLTGAGIIRAIVMGDEVESELTKPFMMNERIEAYNAVWSLVNTGVPHLVTFVDNLDFFNEEMCHQLRHTHNTNVNVATIEEGKLFVRTFERGVEGETLACGTGMAACFYVAYNAGFLGNNVTVYPKSGEELFLRHEEGSLFFKGKVHCSFETVWKEI